MTRFLPKRISILFLALLIPLQGFGGNGAPCASKPDSVDSSCDEAASGEKVGVCCCGGTVSSNRSESEACNATCCCGSSCGCHVQQDPDPRDRSPAEERLPETRRRTVDQNVGTTFSVVGRPVSEEFPSAADADPFYGFTPDLCILLCRYRL